MLPSLPRLELCSTHEGLALCDLLRLFALHGTQTEIPFEVRKSRGGKIAHPHLPEITPYGRIGKHKSRAKDYERHTSEHVERFFVGSICFLGPIHYFNRHGSLL